jgi:hypothetical protein
MNTQRMYWKTKWDEQTIQEKLSRCQTKFQLQHVANDPYSNVATQ